MNHKKLLLRKFKIELLKRARREKTKNRIIFNETATSLKFSSLKVKFQEYRSEMKWAKKVYRPKQPITMESFKNEVEGNYNANLTIEDQQFFIGSTTDSMVFVVPKIKKLLGTSKDFICYGTSEVAPEFGWQCSQLYVIMGISLDNGFDIVYALMKRVTKEAYIDLFNFIINEVDRNWYPDTVSIFFEEAAIGAIQDVFPRTRIVGSWFHHAQSIYRNVRRKGLTQLFKYNNDIHNLILMFMAISLLPRHRLRKAYDELIKLYEDDIFQNLNQHQSHNMGLFFQYYIDTWINGNYSTILSVAEKFRRTSNLLEGSHNHLKAHCGTSYQLPMQFLSKLILYSKINIFDFNLVNNGCGVINLKQERKWHDTNKIIKTATEKLADGRYSLLDFLKHVKHAIPLFGDKCPGYFDERVCSHNLIDSFVNSETSFNITTESLDTRVESPRLVNSPFEFEVPDISVAQNVRYDFPIQLSSSLPTSSPLGTSTLLEGNSTMNRGPPLSPSPIESPDISYGRNAGSSILENSSFEFNESTICTVESIDESVESSCLVNSPFEFEVHGKSTAESIDERVGSPRQVNSPFEFEVLDNTVAELHDDRYGLYPGVLNSPTSTPLESNNSAMYQVQTLSPSPIQSPTPTELSDTYFERELQRLYEEHLFNDEIQFNGEHQFNDEHQFDEELQSPIINITMPDRPMTRQTCVICLTDDVANVEILPCSHMVMCRMCMEGLVNKICPVCREPINTFNIYLI